MAASSDLQGLDLVVGRVVAVAPHPGARAPSFRLQVDFGPRGLRESTVPAARYSAEDLQGGQVVCALEPDGATVLGAHSHAAGLVLIRPDHEVEDGSMVA